MKQFKIAVIPRDRNPYQESLYGPMRAAGFEVRYAAELTRSRTLNLLLLPLELVWLRLRGFRIIHIHWVFGFRFPWRPESRRVGRLSRLWFDLVLRWASLVGLRVVWTAHNTLPHAAVFDDDVIGRRSLVRHSALVIAHSPHALSELADFSPTRTTIIPHGPSGPEQLRTLAPPPAEPARRVLFLGRIAPYKGIDDLLAAMRMVTADLQLVVAGSCDDDELRRTLDAAAAGDPRIELRLGHVPDADLPSLLSAADALVFPFRSITTSGSLLLGMASGRTAIVPDLPALGDLPSDAVISYVPGPEGLAAALTRVTTLPSTELVRKGMAARAAADPATWPELAQRTLTAFDEVLDTPSRFALARANHLLTGSATLLVNTMLLAIGGFVFWAVAARTYTSSSVGVYSGINSLSTLLGSVAALGCPLAIIRFLPGEPQKRRLVVAMIGTVLVLGTCVVALVELIAGPLLFPSVHIPHDLHTAVLTLALVIVASVGAVTDAALITDRATMTVLVKNLIGSVVKVVVLFPLAGLGTTGLITAATIGGVVAALLGAGALWQRLPATSGPWRELERAVEYVRYSLTGYASVLIGILPLTIVPLIVLGVLGKAQAGWFSIAFLISALLSFVPATAAQVLFAEGSRDATALRANTITALKAIYALLLPGAVVLAVCAPWILGLLGHGYEAHAGNALRALAGGSVFLGFTYVIDSILTAMDRMKSFFAINVINSVLVVGLVAHFAHSGLTAVALSWDLAQALSVLFGLAILFGPRLRRAGRSPPPEVADASLSTDAELRSVTTTTGVHRLGFIDGLRGLAAVYVVISHVWDTAFTRRPPSVRTLRDATAFLGFGRYMVALFIVVSGFSIGLGAWRGGLRWPGGNWTYVRRRVRRIWPPYAAAVLISSALAATVLSKDDGTLFDQANNIRPLGVIDHLALIQDIHWWGPAGSSAFWSIAVEFHIYFFFLIVLVLIRRWSWAWQPAVAALMVITALAIGLPHAKLLHFLGGLSPSLYALFIIGFIAAGAAVANAPFNERFWRRFLIAMGAFGCVLIVLCRTHYVALSPLNDFLIGPVAAFLITQMVRGRHRVLRGLLSSRPVVWLGDCSYSIYLIHAVVIEIVWRVAVAPVTHSPLLRLVLELVLGVGASVLVGRCFYYVFERPFLRPTPRPASPHSEGGIKVAAVR